MPLVITEHENPPVDYTPGAAEREPRELPEEIVVYDYEDIFFFYPVILAGILLFFLDWLLPYRVSGAIWMTCIYLSFLAIIPIPRNVFVIVGLSLIVVGLSIIVARFLGVPFAWLGHVLKFLLIPQYSWSMGLAISTFLSALCGVCYVLARFDKKWIINSNQWQHVAWGRSDSSISHGANTATVDYSNVFKWLLLRAGSIVITDNTGKVQIAVLKNVFNLPHRWAYIQEYLEEVRVRQIKPSFR